MNAAVLTMLPERIANKIDFPGDCWEWTAAKVNGYGRINWQYSSRLAHRIVYELLVGPIPTGLVIDHLCRNASCVNPDHLEPVTDAVNILRGVALERRRNATHCKNGHPRTEENIYVDPSDGGRVCRICRRANGQRFRQRRRTDKASA